MTGIIASGIAKPLLFCRYTMGNGEGGIRTLGSLLDYGALAKRCFRPLSHLTNLVAGIWGRADARQQPSGR